MPKSKPLVPPLAFVAESLQLYRENFALFAGLVAWLLVPYILQVLSPLVPDALLAGGFSFLASAVLLVLSVWMTVVLFLLSRSIIARTAVDLPRAQADAWRLMMPLVLVALLETLVVAGGLVLLVIPGLVFSVWYGFAQLAAIFDGKRGFEALTFSKRLVAGRFWSVVWRLVAGPGLILGLYLVTVIAVVSAIGIAANLSEAFFASDAFVMWVDLFSSVVELFFLPWFIIYSSLLYENLTGQVWLKR